MWHVSVYSLNQEQPLLHTFCIFRLVFPFHTFAMLQNSDVAINFGTEFSYRISRNDDYEYRRVPGCDAVWFRRWTTALEEPTAPCTTLKIQAAGPSERHTYQTIRRHIPHDSMFITTTLRIWKSSSFLSTAVWRNSQRQLCKAWTCSMKHFHCVFC